MSSYTHQILAALFDGWNELPETSRIAPTIMIFEGVNPDLDDCPLENCRRALSIEHAVRSANTVWSASKNRGDLQIEALINHPNCHHSHLRFQRAAVPYIWAPIQGKTNAEVASDIIEVCRLLDEAIYTKEVLAELNTEAKSVAELTSEGVITIIDASFDAFLPIHFPGHEQIEHNKIYELYEEGIAQASEAASEGSEIQENVKINSALKNLMSMAIQRGQYLSSNYIDSPKKHRMETRDRKGKPSIPVIFSVADWSPVYEPRRNIVGQILDIANKTKQPIIILISSSEPSSVHRALCTQSSSAFGGSMTEMIWCVSGLHQYISGPEIHLAVENAESNMADFFSSGLNEHQKYNNSRELFLNVSALVLGENFEPARSWSVDFPKSDEFRIFSLQATFSCNVNCPESLKLFTAEKNNNFAIMCLSMLQRLQPEEKMANFLCTILSYYIEGILDVYSSARDIDALMALFKYNGLALGVFEVALNFGFFERRYSEMIRRYLFDISLYAPQRYEDELGRMRRWLSDSASAASPDWDIAFMQGISLFNRREFQSSIGVFESLLKRIKGRETEVERAESIIPLSRDYAKRAALWIEERKSLASENHSLVAESLKFFRRNWVKH